MGLLQMENKVRKKLEEETTTESQSKMIKGNELWINFMYIVLLTMIGAFHFI